MRVYSRLLSLLLALLMAAPVWAQAKPGTPTQTTQPPATLTELSQKGVSLKPEVIGPSKGVYTNIADLLRDNAYAKVLNNLQMTSRGIWTSRGIGTTKHRANSFNSGAKILEFATHTTSAGVNRFVFQAGSKVYSYALDTTTETEIKNSLSTTAVPSIRSFSPTYMLYCNGDINPLKWNGDPSSSMAALSGWPVTISAITYDKPKYVEVFASRACWAGFADKPFTVVLSKQSDPETYTVSSPVVATDAGAFDVPSQLGKITGLRALRLSNDTNDQVLLIGCERGMAIITGSSGTDFALKELTREFGLASNRAWVQLQNDLLFMATDGIRRYSQLVTNVNLVNASVTFGVQDLMNRVNTTYRSGAFAVHHPATQEVQFWFPVDSETTNGHAVILNYNTQDLNQTSSLETLDFILSTKDGFSPTAGIEVDGIMYHGDASGYLWKDYTGDDYGGTAISWEYVSPLIGTNSPAQNASLRKFVIITDGPAQQFMAYPYTVDTLGSGVTEWRSRGSRSIAVSSSTITKVGTWASGTTTSYTKLIDYAPTGSGRYWALQLKGSATNDHISLVGIMSILTVGGWKQ